MKLIIEGKIQGRGSVGGARTLGWKTLEDGFGALQLISFELLHPEQISRVGRQPS